MVRTVVCLVAATACATQHHEVTLQVAATQVCADQLCTTQASVTISSVVYRRNAAEAWQAVPLAGSAVTSVQYAFEVDSEYEVVALGTQPPAFGSGSSTPVVAELLGNADDDASPVVLLGTGEQPPSTPPTYAVSVSMQQPGTIFVG